MKNNQKENIKEKMAEMKIQTNNQKNARNKRNIKSSERAITLVALVVTIIILLILAGVTIGAITSNTGLLSRTQDAKAKYENASQNEISDMNEITSKIDEYAGGSQTQESSTLEIAKTNGTAFTQPTIVTDSLGNTVKVPKGFKIASDSGTTIPDGIVIEDVSANDTTSAGNQFVWIPVGTVKKSATETVDIVLGRYTFASTGAESLVQNASDYASDVAINTYYHELQTSSYGNATAKNLQNFVTSVATNGGYYLARYEAGKVTGDTTKCVSKYNTTVYNSITQPNSSTVAKAMYTTNVTSDLMNSYAWDTAIVFIEKCGTKTNSANYGNQHRLQTSLTTTGKATNGTNYDVQCNIYDMAGNVWEWSTESYSNSLSPCVGRGGNYYSSTFYTAYRNNTASSNSNDRLGFRPLLYL